MRRLLGSLTALFLTGALMSADAAAQFKVPVDRDCYCTNRGQRVEIGEKSCLSINGKLFEAQCYMSENTPGWRRLGEGCRERPLAAAQQSTTG